MYQVPGVYLQGNPTSSVMYFWDFREPFFFWNFVNVHTFQVNSLEAFRFLPSRAFWTSTPSQNIHTDCTLLYTINSIQSTRSLQVRTG